MPFQKGYTLNPKNTLEDVWKKIDKRTEDECWEWMGCKNWDGYGTIKINQILWGVHRLVYELTYGSIPKELFVCHKCNNPSCCNPKHLYVGTPKDNMDQRDREERQAMGEKNGRSKLTKQDVLEIRRLYSLENYSQRKLGEMFGICKTQISRIINRKNWRYV